MGRIINLTNISSELRLLAVFDAVIRTGSVSRAAEMLGMSQPAASMALNRLRDLMNDQLFVRRRDGMEPTPLALSIAEEVRGAIDVLQEVLRRREFDPGRTDRAFSLAVSDHASVVLLPDLVRHVNTVAPGVTLRVDAKLNPQLAEHLDSGEVDLAVGIMPDAMPRRFARTKLFSDRYLCMMRRDHPLAGRPLTLDALAEADHLAIRPGNNAESRVDRLLAAHGAQRRITMTVHQFLAAPGVVARSDMLAFIFERMQSVLDPEAFRFVPVEDADMGVRVDVAWNRARGEHDSHRWLRGQLAAVARLLPASDAEAGQVA